MDTPLSRPFVPLMKSGLSALIVLAGSCLIFLAGCKEHHDSHAAGAATQPLTVQETFDQLRQWHQAGLYTAMRPYIDEESCEDTIDLLVAVDRLMAANHDFLAAIQRACPEMDVRPYDLSFTRDNLDLFSREVVWVGAKADSEDAVVTAAVSGRLPLREIRFRKQVDRWVYVPGPEDPAVIKAIRQMCRSLNQIELVALTKQPTDQQIQEEYRVRILSKIKGLGMPELRSPDI